LDERNRRNPGWPGSRRGGLDELNRLGEPHSIRYFGDWIPDVKAAYNLRLIGE